MRKVEFFLAGLLVGGVALFAACSRKPVAVGNQIHVSVVADSSIYQTIRDELKRALEKTVYTPWPESMLVLDYVAPAKANKIVRHPNVIMAGVLRGADWTSRQVTAMLPAGVFAQIQNKESFVFRKQDPWARKQLLLVLVSTDTLSLKQQIAASGDYLFELIREQIFKRTAAEMYSDFEQKDIEKTLLEKYGWRVRVQHDYVIFREFAEKNFVMLRRIAPERWLFVYWEDAADPGRITREWLLDQRREIGKRFYENDTVPDTLMRVRETEFAGRRALEVQGLWENEQKVAGGPFKAFAFYDEDTRRAYIVDIAVFAPGRMKEGYLRQLEVMARTFRTAADLRRIQTPATQAGK